MNTIVSKIEAWFLMPLVDALIKYTSKCTECGHLTHYHREEPGENYCTHGSYKNAKGWACYPCSCGYHTGR
jgi:hypothetical protein